MRNKLFRIISLKDKCAVNKVSTAEKGEGMTSLSAILEAGNFIQLTLIYDRKNMQSEIEESLCIFILISASYVLR